MNLKNASEMLRKLTRMDKQPVLIIYFLSYFVRLVAISKMKMKMQKDKSINRTQAYIQNLITLKSHIEDASSMKDTVQAFEVGVNLLKQTNEEMFES